MILSCPSRWPSTVVSVSRSMVIVIIVSQGSGAAVAGGAGAFHWNGSMLSKTLDYLQGCLEAWKLETMQQKDLKR